MSVFTVAEVTVKRKDRGGFSNHEYILVGCWVVCGGHVHVYLCVVYAGMYCTVYNVKIYVQYVSRVLFQTFFRFTSQGCLAQLWILGKAQSCPWCGGVGKALVVCVCLCVCQCVCARQVVSGLVAESCCFTLPVSHCTAICHR